MSRRLPRSARIARRRAPRVNPWVQLALLVVGLVVLLSFWERIADGTAGCYSHMAAEGDAAEPAPTTGAPGPHEESDPRAVSFEVRLPGGDTGRGASEGPERPGAPGAALPGPPGDAAGEAPDGARADDAQGGTRDPAESPVKSGPSGAMGEK